MGVGLVYFLISCFNISFFPKKFKNSTFFGKSSISLNLIAKQVHLFQWYVYLGHPGDDGERDIYLSWKLFVWASSEFW